MEIAADGDTGAGGGGGSVAWPPVDIGAVTGAARTFTTIGQRLSDNARSTLSSSGYVPHWNGAARQAWDGALQSNGHTLDGASEQFGAAGRALSAFAETATQLAADYQRAVRQETAARGAMALLPKPGAAGPTPAPSSSSAMGDPFSPLPSPASALASQVHAAVAAEQTAVTELQTAARVAGSKVEAAMSSLPRPMHLAPAGAANVGPTAPFAEQLVHVIIGNRVAGKAFELKVLHALAVAPNGKTFKSAFRSKGVRPDGIVYQDGHWVWVYEIKGVLTQSRSSQIREEMRLARLHHASFVLVVQQRTHVSGPLKAQLGRLTARQGHPALITSMGNGTYEGPGKRDYGADPKTHSFVPIDTKPGEPVKAPSRTGRIDIDPQPWPLPKGGGGQIGPGGEPEPEPIEPGGDPVVPELPALPGLSGLGG